MGMTDPAEFTTVWSEPHNFTMYSIAASSAWCMCGRQQEHPIHNTQESGGEVEHDHDPGGCTCGCPVPGCLRCGGLPQKGDQS